MEGELSLRGDAKITPAIRPDVSAIATGVTMCM